MYSYFSNTKATNVENVENVYKFSVCKTVSGKINYILKNMNNFVNKKKTRK